MIEVVRLTWAELKALPEYSCSLPTGTTIGKRWKKNQHAYHRPHADTCSAPHVHEPRGIICPCIQPFGTMCPECLARYKMQRPSWFMGEYFEMPGNSAEVGIVWRRIVILPPEPLK